MSLISAGSISLDSTFKFHSLSTMAGGPVQQPNDGVDFILQSEGSMNSATGTIVSI